MPTSDIWLQNRLSEVKSTLSHPFEPAIFFIRQLAPRRAPYQFFFCNTFKVPTLGYFSLKGIFLKLHNEKMPTSDIWLQNRFSEVKITRSSPFEPGFLLSKGIFS